MPKNINTSEFDVIVIGAGPGGYVAAIRCAQLGLKTACVDEWLDHQQQSSLGGTCLNVGCIPSKALLESSHLFSQANTEFSEHGIKLDNIGLDIVAMQARKNRVVKELTQGISTLFKANKVTLLNGRAKIHMCDEADNNKHKHCVYVKDRKSRKRFAKLMTGNIIVATGSSPIRLQQAPLIDGYILDSAGALELTNVPKKLGIIGAGAIGLELGSIWQRLGSKVVLYEAMHEFLPAVDKSVSRQALKVLSKQGLDIRIGSRLVSTQVKNKKVTTIIEVHNGDGTSKKETDSFDQLIVAVGRKPNSERVLGEEVSVETDERGFILVDEHYETAVPGIYAIGDVIGGAMLAHKASEQGVMVASHIKGESAGINDGLIPSVIYTHPEISWVGKSEQQCQAERLNYKVGQFPLAANGRARAAGDSEGLIKIISDASTDQILGVHVMAAQASEIIAQAVIAMEMQATSEDLALTIFAHPTLSEALHEAALSVQGKAIHIKN